MSNSKTIRIGELSRRSGFSVRALRYYEEIGLLQPAARSESDYRLYDEEALHILATIKRMKLLGLPLAAVGELRAIHREQGRCAPVRQRLLDLLNEQVRRIDEQVSELLALRSDLVAYAENCRQRTAAPGEMEKRCQESLGNQRAAPGKGEKADHDGDGELLLPAGAVHLRGRPVPGHRVRHRAWWPGPA